MNLSIHNSQGIFLLLAEGSIEEKDLARITEEIEGLPVQQDKYILLDCADIRKLIFGKIGFSGLITQLLLLRTNNTKIILYGYDTFTYRLLTMLKLDEVFHYAQTLDDAYLMLNKTYKESVKVGTA